MDEQRAWIRSRRRRRLRIVAVILCMCLLATTHSDILAALSALASEWKDGTVYVSGFGELPEAVRAQTVPVGTGIEGLSLPDTLEAFAETPEDEDTSGDVDGEGADKPGEAEDGKENQPEDGTGEPGDGSGDAGNAGEGSGDGTGDAGNMDDGTGGAGEPGSGSDDAGNVDEGSGDGTGDAGNADDGTGDAGNVDEGTGGAGEPGGGSGDAGNAGEGSGDAGNSENVTDGVSGDAGNADEGNSGEGEPESQSDTAPADDEGGAGDAGETAKGVGGALTVRRGVFTMPVYLSEPVDAAEPQTMERKAESVMIKGVTWQSEPAYDGSVEGNYVFTAVLPDGYALTEGISLPQITVTVQGTDPVVQELLARIAALPEAEEYLADEPDVEEKDEYEAWMDELSAYTEEALGLWEMYETFTEEQRAQVPTEALVKLAAWVELAGQLAESSQVLAAADGWNDFGEGYTTKWKLEGNTLTISGTGEMPDWKANSTNINDSPPWIGSRGDIMRVIINEGVTNIGSLAFRDCKVLTDIDIPNSVASIGNEAFSCCSNLTSITIPDSVTSIGGSAFFCCYKLTDITISKNVKGIGGSAFFQCSSLTSITIPDGVTSIGGSAFSQCTSLTSVTFQGTVNKPTLGTNCFYGCPCVAEGTKGLDIPSCSYLTVSGWLTYKDHVTKQHTLTGYQSDTEHYWICNGCGTRYSETINAENCSFSRRAVDSNYEVTFAPKTGYDVPAEVTVRIGGTTLGSGDYTYTTDSKVGKLTIPKNKITGDVSITATAEVKQVTIEVTLKKDGSPWNGQTVELKSENKEHTYQAEERADNKGTYCSTIVGDGYYRVYVNGNAVPFSFQTTGDTVSSQIELTYQYVSVTYEANGATGEVPGREDCFCGSTADGVGRNYVVKTSRPMTKPGYVQTGWSESSDGEAVDKISVNDGEGWVRTDPITLYPVFEPATADWTAIADSDLQWKLENGTLTIKGSGAMPDWASYSETPWYSNRGSIKSIIIGDEVTSIGDWAFFDCGQLTSAVIPESVISIGSGAFQTCNNLTGVIIPKNVTTIQAQAFALCSHLTTVVIPESVTSIGNSAFQNCRALSSVTFTEGSVIPTLGTDCFTGCPCVAEGTKGLDIPSCKYLTAAGWEPYKAHVTKQHTLTHTAEVPATCEAAGTEEYWTCEECGTLFSDAAGTTVITAPVTILATGHALTYAADDTADTITESCSNSCGHSAAAGFKTTINAPYTYTGSGIEPFDVSYTGGTWLGTTIPAISYSFNTNAGTATAFLSVGEKRVQKTFTIDKKAISDVSVTLPSDSYPYTGNAITPEVTVKDGSRTLAKDTEYTVAYADNTAVGTNTAKVTVTGTGNYTGVRTLAFTIQDKAPEVSGDDLDFSGGTAKLPDDMADKVQKGEVEIYDSDGNQITPNPDGSLPVEPGTTITIKYPGSDKEAEIKIPPRPAAPAPVDQGKIEKTDTTVKAPKPEDGAAYEYVLVEKGEEPDWSRSNTTGEFTGLDPNKEYDLYMRKPATEDSFASEPVKTEIRTSVTIKDPETGGAGAGKPDNDVSGGKPGVDGDSVTYTGTCEGGSTPVIIVDGKEIVPEITWDVDGKKGTWSYTVPVKDGDSEVGIRVEFKDRVYKGLAIEPGSLRIYADNAANQGADKLLDYLKSHCTVKAAYDNGTSDNVTAGAVYTADKTFVQKGGEYQYTVEASADTGKVTLTVSPVTAAVKAPDALSKSLKPDGYTKAEVDAWLPEKITVTYTGTDGYAQRTEGRAVTWDTDALGAGFGAVVGSKAISGTVDLPAWATGENKVGIEVKFVDRQTLADDQMQLSISGWAYGAQTAPAPKGSVTVTDTEQAYTYSYSADGGASWVTAVGLPKSASGHIIPGDYLVEMAYTGRNYTGKKRAAFTVVQKPVTAEKGTLAVEDRNYDGTQNATLKAGGKPALSGVFANDDVSLSGTLKAVFTGKGPKKNIPVTVTGFALAGKDAGYYKLINTTLTLKATINNKDGSSPSSGSGSSDSGNGGDGGNNSGSSGDNGNGGNSSGGSGNSGNTGAGGNNGTGGNTGNGGNSSNNGGNGGNTGGTTGGSNKGTGSTGRGSTGRGSTGSDSTGGTGKSSAIGTGKGSTGTGSTSGTGKGTTGTGKGNTGSGITGGIDKGNAGTGSGSTNGTGKDSVGSGSGSNGGTGNGDAGARQADDGQQAKTVTVQTVQAETNDGRIVLPDGTEAPVAIGNLTEDAPGATRLMVGEGTVTVTVVCEDGQYTVGMNDATAVANAVLTPEQVQLVDGGERLEVRVDIKNIAQSISPQDRETVEKGFEAYRKYIPELVRGGYVDISVYTKTGDGGWNAVAETMDPLEVVIGIPEELRGDGREYYIIRAHEGKYALLNDMDAVPETITIVTDQFSSYAIAYREAGAVRAGNDETAYGLSHIPPKFLGIVCLICLTAVVAGIIIVVIVLRRKKSREKEKAV